MRARTAALLSLVVALSISSWAQTTLSIQPAGGTNRWVRVRSTDSAGSLLTLEATTNFATWQTIAITHDRFWNMPDAGADNFTNRLYRVRSSKLNPSDDWKNELLFPEEPLRSPDGQDLRWVKFAIQRNDPARVFFQDS